uniref:Toxin CSTX-16 (Fragments) n=1 Tax=Cupiennius salei TaxID=6928 RepID=TXC16_CUPSA|nr:RecName: Full=Toxin CSTX-16; Contains: RecName: Full=CSTX-16 A chain; Contains: RecName: Full=CSTX-16 B chain; Flags: Precursor [Cupiennius salei]
NFLEMLKENCKLLWKRQKQKFRIPMPESLCQILKKKKQ